MKMESNGSKMWEIKRRRLARYKTRQLIVGQFLGRGLPNDDDWSDVQDAMAVEFMDRLGVSEREADSMVREEFAKVR